MTMHLLLKIAAMIAIKNPTNDSLAAVRQKDRKDRNASSKDSYRHHDGAADNKQTKQKYHQQMDLTY